MLCRLCGKESRAEALFCAWCGERLLADGKSADEDDERGALKDVAAPQEGLQEDGPSGKAIDRVPPDSIPPPDGTVLGGSLLAGRYRVLATLADDEQGRPRYSGADLRACGYCGSTLDSVDADYCASCGAAATSHPLVELSACDGVELPTGPESISVGGAAFDVRPAATGVGRSERGVRLSYGLATDAGRQRERNEDAVDTCLYSRHGGDALGFFVVCDGMGGHQGGEMASRLAVAAAWEWVCQEMWLPYLRGDDAMPSRPDEILAAAVRHANEVVFAERQRLQSNMCTTLTAALIVNRTAFVANVGDSRTYLFSGDGLRAVTRDHSFVQSLIEGGAITREDAYTHPERYLVCAGIGDQGTVNVDTCCLALGYGDRLVLCSDGLWEALHDEGIEEVLMSESDLQRACSRLVQYSNLAGGDDNISVIVVEIGACEA